MSNNTPKSESEKLRLAGFDAIYSSDEKGVLLLNTHHIVSECNEASFDILGTDAVGKKILELFDNVTGFNKAFKDVIAAAIFDHKNLDQEGYCEDLNKWLRVQIIALEGGTIVFLKDITKEKEHQRYVEELARFPEETWNPVLKFNIDGTIVYTNSRCEAILQAWGTQRWGKLPADVTATVRKSIETNTAQEVEVICKNDQIFSILLAPVPEANATYVYGRDVTLLKEHERELTEHRDRLEDLVYERTKELEQSRDEAERASRAKSSFLANMSHEIRTPLAAIIGFGESLFDSQSEEDKNHAIQTIIRSGMHLKNIVNNILDLSKIEAEKVELEVMQVSVFELLSDIYSIIDAQAKEKGIKFGINYHYPLPETIETDPVRFKQILINLCNNAVKFTQEGSISIEIRCDFEGENLAVQVIDTGIGMSEDQADKIFQPFTQADSSTTRKFGGTGLGLTLSKQLANLLGGDLRVTSVQDKGSTFELLISTGNLANVPTTHSMNHTSRSNTIMNENDEVSLIGRVLLAEDTKELQDLTRYLVSRTGAEIEIAENGKQAIEKAVKGEFDLILMDMQMPVLDGYEAVKFLRRLEYAQPIIAMTANTMKQDRDRALDSGCDDFLGKPINRDDLYAILTKYLDMGKTSAQCTPLYSELINEVPEMRDLVVNFVAQLPDRIQNCYDTLADGDWSALEAELHIIKGLGGGHGYPSITETARSLENALKKLDTNSLNEGLKDLKQLAANAKAGLDKE